MISTQLVRSADGTITEQPAIASPGFDSFDRFAPDVPKGFFLKKIIFFPNYMDIFVYIHIILIVTI